VSNAAALPVQQPDDGPLLITSASEINGSVLRDTFVQRNCSLHVRGNVLGSLTIEPGAKVVVEGSVDGKIINKGGRLVVNNKGLAACVTLDGPPEAEACGILKIDLTALVANYEALTKRTGAECAGVVKANAYGCGIDQIAGALAKSGCRTFFVSNIPEARRVRAVAPRATIYVLNGLHSGNAAAFAEINARPVINSPIEMAEWDVFVAAQQWSGEHALNIDTGLAKRGLSLEEAAAFAPRLQTLNNGVALLMSRLDHPERIARGANERQITAFHDLRRLYSGVPASLVNSSGIFLHPKAHFDVVRAGSALYGINPTPGHANPMQPVLELRTRILQVRNMAPGETIAGNPDWIAKRRTWLAVVSTGYADGYPRPGIGARGKLQAVIGGHRCPVAGSPSTDLLAIDVTDLPDDAAARYGELVTLIGAGIGIDDLAAGADTTGCEILSRLGSRFHRVYFAV